MKKQTIVIMVLTVALAISLTVNIVLGCCWPSAEVAQLPSEQTEPTTLNSTLSESETSETVTEMVEIPTPYGSLQFPKEYNDRLVHEGIQEQDVYAHTFSMTHGDGTVKLFVLYFGDEANGTLIGSVKADGKQVPITVVSMPLEKDDTWSQADTDLFYAMQMAINDVIPSAAPWENALS